MLMDVLRNTRLLERFAIFNGTEDDVPGVPGTPEYLFLSVLKSLRAGALDTAKVQYNELAAVLSVPLDSQQLEPLRTILHLKLWDGSTEDKRQLQNFLTKELRLKFEADVLPSIPAQPTPLTGTGNEPTPSQPCDTPQLPTHISPDLYSPTAFRKLLHPDNVPPNQPLSAQYDPSRLSEVVAEGSIPIQQRAVLLQQGCVAPAALSVGILTRVVQEWLAADSERGWNCKDAFEWVTNGWNDVTAEQAGALRAILPGPSFGSNPTVDRPYIVALVNKALAGPAAAAAAAASGPGVAEAAPWACGAAYVAAATELERILEVCDKLGPAADWIRLLAVHAQLLLQQMQQAAVDMSLYIDYMKMLGQATWSPGPTVTDNRFGTQQQQQQPMHLPCNVCGMRPIAGPRFRSLSQFGFNTCAGCVRSPQAADAAPMEEIRVDDSIYMSPEVPLPPVLGQVSPNEAEREAEARNMLLELVQADGAAGSPERFSPEADCPLAAAGLLLPREWRNKAVAEGKLLRGQSNRAAWSRLYQESKGKVEELRQRSELAFAPHNKESYTLQEEIVLELVTKNNGQQGVLVKLYEINCWNYYTIERKAIDLNLELSGLTPTRTIHFNTPEDPIIRCRHSIPLGLAGRAGVWLAEVVAGGTRVRARIYKGIVRLVQRPSVAGQVLTIVDEDWRPVKGVRIWCDNQEYKSKPDGKPNEVVLPYSRDVRSTSLVVAATLTDHDKAGAPSGGARAGNTTTGIAQATECVTLFEGFRRLKEQYSLHGQLYCHPESLLPGQAVPILLQLSLQLHGRSAPLKLLQEVTLRVTAATHDGAEVTQVFKDLTLDPATGELKLQYNLPPAARQLSAVLTARILLTLPGTNGEPAYQDFDLNQLFFGRNEAAACIGINAAAASSSIWDVYLSVQASSSGCSEPEYVLQVLGRAGEAPAVPKVLSVLMTHVQYSPQQEVQFRVQTGPGGVVRLGPLTGIRQIDAQIAGGLDCVAGFAVTTSHAALGRFGSSVRSRAGPGPVRKWQIARTSWWQSRLQREYTIAAGTDLEIPLTTALGQTLDPKLLQLLQQGKASSYTTGSSSQVVVADISSEHLLVTPANAAAGAAGSSSSAATGAMLGSSGTAVLQVQGLAPGRYRLLVPALLLDLPDQISLGGFGSTGVNPNAGAIHIHVLPAVQAAAAAVQDAPAAAASADAGSSSSAQQAAGSPSWLWAGSSQLDVPAVITQPSAANQLHVTSLSCSTTYGLFVQLTGTSDQIESARIVAVFGRFLSDSSGVSSDMLYDTVALGNDIMGQPAQTCGTFGVCDYSRAAKLDSAVAYVLQRRQWEAEARRGGGIRPGSLLDRPSLLVVPVCKKSAASGTSVLRGGDGQRLHAKKKQMHPHPPMFGAASFAAPASCRAVSAAYRSTAPGGGYGELECGFTSSYSSAQSPVLSFLLNPGVVLMDLEVDVNTGLVSVSAQELQQLLTAAVGPQIAALGGSEAGLAVLSSYSHVYVAAYVLQEQGQFSGARCVVQGAVSAEQMTQPSSRRDLGLMRTVQEDDILALSCDVLALQPGASLTLPSDPAAAEAAIYSTSQQFYQLLAGLLEISEAAWGPPSYGGGCRSVARRGLVAGALQSKVGDSRAVKHLLPRPCAPPNAGESNNAELLRQWEPLLLQWSQLSGSDRLDLLDKLNSTEAAFFLACRDPQAYQQLILPLLRSKLPSELTCLEQILLLQATHDQPARPTVTTTTTSTAGHELTAVYDSAKQQLLQHWYAPHRYQRLTALEQVMLAALDGAAALMDLSRDMRASLKTPEERRGVKKTWMSPDRRALFDFALLLSKQLDQQQGQEQQQAQELQQQQQAIGGAEYVSLDGIRFDSQCAVLPTESDDFVHVQYADLQQQQQQVICGAAAPLPPPPGAPGPGTLAMGVSKPQMLMRECAAADESDLAARASVAAAAMKSARLAPKETQEWTEGGWWKWDGQQTPPDLIPVSHFWADFAEHLATKPDQPFIPTDPTGTASSTAAIVAALAVIGQTHGAGLLETTAAAADSSSIGCSKVSNGLAVTLTATSPCLLWIKQAKSVASIAAAAAAATAGSSGPVPPAAQPAVAAGPAGAVVVQGGTSSVLVTERLYDPRFASMTDPETGEQLLLALLPSEQQPLLAGQSYRQSVIITSTGAAEQHLDILVQIPQGALPLSDSPSTISVSITLAPYATHTLDMSFYFPQAGVYKRAPASVTKRGRPAWLPVSAPLPLYVADRPDPTALGTQQQQQVARLFDWSEFLKTASRDAILEYLSTGDLSVATLGDLSPYCKDRVFFTAATSTLSKRHTYNSGIWKWAVAHMDGTTLQQLLPMSGLAQTAFGRQLPVSHLPFMQMSGHDIGVWQLEYWPWVNPYCRPIPRDDGGDSSLPSVLTDNPSIAEQWRSFLLASLFDFSKGTSNSGLSLAQATSAAVYLLLQDRVDETEDLLRQFDLEAAAAELEDGAPLRMQVDYLRAWMALCRPVAAAGELPTSVASALALGKYVVERYKKCASQAWRKRFAQLNILVRELEQQQAAGGAAAVSEGPDVAPEDNAAMLSIISCEAGQLKFQYRGLSNVCLSAYQIDTELLFTTQPFSSLSSSNNSDASGQSRRMRRNADDSSTLGLGKVAYVRPSVRVELSLTENGAATADDQVQAKPDPSGPTTVVYDVDEMLPELKSQSVLLELSGGGISRTVPRYGSRLVVHIIESQGILQACYAAESSTSSGGHMLLPAAATYVKVFARDASGDEWFYKDGYTDLRGKFDYVTLTSTADMSRVSRFSLLVASPELGALMQQAAPLPRQ